MVGEYDEVNCLLYECKDEFRDAKYLILIDHKIQASIKTKFLTIYPFHINETTSVFFIIFRDFLLSKWLT